MDHYRTLQVARGADIEVIEKAYKALCLKYHPDVVPDEHRPHATARMQAINAAWGVLKDPVARTAYDLTLPREGGADAWETFMSKGLLGMLFERVFPGR